MANRLPSQANLSPQTAATLTHKANEALMVGGGEPSKVLSELTPAAFLNPLLFDLQKAYLNCLTATGDQKAVIAHCEHLVAARPEQTKLWDIYISTLDNMGKPRSDIVHVEIRAQAAIPGYISPTAQPELPQYHHTP